MNEIKFRTALLRIEDATRVLAAAVDAGWVGAWAEAAALNATRHQRAMGACAPRPNRLPHPDEVVIRLDASGEHTVRRLCDAARRAG